jgi:hypothetical protein
MKDNKTFIIFNRDGALEILRYTNLELISVGDLWIQAKASDADIQTFELNNWSYRKG